jgi:hypothetical protein
MIPQHTALDVETVFEIGQDNRGNKYKPALGFCDFPKEYLSQIK